MLTLLAYAGYVRRPSAGRYALVALALGLGLISKTMVVSLPIVLLLLDFWPLRRIFSPATPPRRTSTHFAPRYGGVLIEKLPLIGLAVAASAVTVVTQTTVRGVKSLEMVPMAWRLVNAPLAYVRYLLMTIWPADLAAMYPHPALLASSRLADYVWPAIGAALLLLALTALALAAARRAPYVAVGWLWYLVTLVPVIGLVQVGMQSHADRYTYLPMLGIYVIAAWGLRDAIAARPALRVPAAAACGVVLALLAVLSWRQAATWRSSTTVFTQMLAATEGNYFAHQSLAATLIYENRDDEARRHLDEALRIRPNESYAHRQLALWHERRGDVESAAAEYALAVQYNPAAFQARTKLAQIRFQQQRWDEVATVLTPVIGDIPNDVQSHLNLGIALQQLDRHADALPYLERAAALAPNSAQAQNNYGVALARVGRYDEAAARFERTLALNPAHGTAAKSLAWVRSQAR
jgi:Tfp pilus assembly protein PilF